METCKAFRVSGRVQGVSFRASCKKKADELGLVGWVRNCANGDVEGVARGTDDQLARFRDWLQTGPPMASVEGLEFEASEQESFSGFAIR